MFIGRTLNLRDARRDPAREPVDVLLWQSRHNDHTIEWLTAPEPGARRVHIKHAETRAPYFPARKPGERWTRTIVTIERQLAERLDLPPLTVAQVAAIRAERDAHERDRAAALGARRGIGTPSWLR